MLVGLVCALAASFVTVVSATSPAAADDVTCGPGEVKVFVPPASYVCQSTGETTEPGTPPTGGGTDAPAPPTCDLTLIDGSQWDNPTSPYCDGKRACVTVDNFPPLLPPKGDKPKEDSKERVEVCSDGTANYPGTPFWSDDEEPPTLLQQAQEAIGNIDLGAPTIELSPPTRSIVNIDTWFWLAGAQREVQGSSAFGLVAIATFKSLTVDPGDGTGAFTCTTFPNSAAEAEKSCFHAYRRASVRGSAEVGGRPAYGVTATTVYSLRFEVDGEQVDVVGAPATLSGPPAQAAVRVDEVQSVVKSG